jgi:hypothetical protein
MATYGYRVHTMHPFLKRSEDELLIEDVSQAGGPTDAFLHLYESLLALQGKTNVGSPTYFQSTEADEAKLAANEKAEDLSYLTVLNVDHIGRVMTVSVETGKEADHDALVGRDGSHENIKKKAAVRRSSIVFDFPSRGSAALMISEVRGRSFAGELLLAWVTRTAQRATVSVDAKGNRKEEPWLNWRLKPQIDGERLDGILSGSAEHTIKLRRRGVSAKGSRASYDLELTQVGLKNTPISKVLDVLQAMADRRNKGTEFDRRAAAKKDVVGLVDTDVSGISFDDAEVSFLEHGKRQTINSETIDRLFVYPIGGKRPEAADLVAHSALVVKRIAKGLGIPRK